MSAKIGFAEPRRLAQDRPGNFDFGVTRKAPDQPGGRVWHRRHTRADLGERFHVLLFEGGIEYLVENLDTVFIEPRRLRQKQVGQRLQGLVSFPGIEMPERIFKFVKGVAWHFQFLIAKSFFFGEKTGEIPGQQRGRSDHHNVGVAVAGPLCPFGAAQRLACRALLGAIVGSFPDHRPRVEEHRDHPVEQGFR